MRQYHYYHVRAALFVAAAVILVTLGALYSGANLYAAEEEGTIPPYNTLEISTSPRGGVRPNQTLTYTITINPSVREEVYSFTLGLTATVPLPLTVIPNSLSASTADLPVIMNNNTVTWTSLFEPPPPTAPITISFAVSASEWCYPLAQEGSNNIIITDPTRPLTSTVIVSELINEVVTKTPPSLQTTGIVTWTGPDCVTLLPHIINSPTPTPQPPLPQLPKLVNGNLDAGGQGWTQVPPGSIIYPKERIPVTARSGVAGKNAAWLGGASPSDNVLAQPVSIPEAYKGQVRLKFRFFAESDESNCNNDWGKFQIVSGSNTVKEVLYPLCRGQNTLVWKMASVDLGQVSGPVELRFVSKLNQTLNSNWFLDNFELCSSAANAPAGTPICP